MLTQHTSHHIFQIKINIIDINNKFPQVGLFEQTIEMFENATTGDFITQIVATDADRDAPHNTIQYTINFMEFADLQKYFAVDDITGVLKVQLDGSNVLNRDDGSDEHVIGIRLVDNYLGNGGNVVLFLTTRNRCRNRCIKIHSLFQLKFFSSKVL